MWDVKLKALLFAKLRRFIEKKNLKINPFNFWFLAVELIREKKKFTFFSIYCSGYENVKEFKVKNVNLIEIVSWFLINWFLNESLKIFQQVFWVVIGENSWFWTRKWKL